METHYGLKALGPQLRYTAFPRPNARGLFQNLKIFSIFALFFRLIKAKPQLNALIEGTRPFQNRSFGTAPSIIQEGFYAVTKRIGRRCLVRGSYGG
jgi:hypothetical protein